MPPQRRPPVACVLAVVLGASACSLARAPLSLGARDASVPPTDVPIPDDAPLAVDTLEPDDAGCTEGSMRCGEDGSLERCVATEWSSAPCSLGCEAAPVAHCRQLVPSNVPEDLFAAGGPVVVPSATSWSTDGCASLPGLPMEVAQSDGSRVCVVRVDSLVVAAGAVLSVSGSLPIIVLALGEVSIAGTLDVSARGSVPGPGGGRGATAGATASGPSPGASGAHVGMYSDAGGAGGALCGAGGGGGTGGAATGPGSAMAVSGDLRPLRGGSGGGLGGTGGSAGGGGAGGGAMQITARGMIIVDGTILAAGGGGAGGDDSVPGDNNVGAGGGGGSGGAVLLEAPAVVVSGAIAANGGGGGGAAGCIWTGVAGRGADGTATASAAAGGTPGAACASGTNQGAAGGAGTGGSALAGSVGGSNPGPSANGGGGGGGAGCIVIRDASSAAPGGELSPSIAPGVRTLPLVTM